MVRSIFKKSGRRWREKVAAYEAQHPGLSQRLSYMRDEGLGIIRADLVGYARIHARGIVRTLSGLASHGYIRVLKLFPGSEQDWLHLIARKGLLGALMQDWQTMSRAVIMITVLLGVFMVLIYVLSAVALFSRNFLTRMAMVSLCCVVLYWLIITGGPHGYSRYRHAIMPILSVWAGYGLYLMVNRVKPDTANHKGCP